MPLITCEENGCHGSLEKPLFFFLNKVPITGFSCIKCGRVYQEIGGIKKPVFTKGKESIFFSNVLKTIQLRP